MVETGSGTTAMKVELIIEMTDRMAGKFEQKGHLAQLNTLLNLEFGNSPSIFLTVAKFRVFSSAPLVPSSYSRNSLQDILPTKDSAAGQLSRWVPHTRLI
jgi:hypothetical protein